MILQDAHCVPIIYSDQWTPQACSGQRNVYVLQALPCIVKQQVGIAHSKLGSESESLLRSVAL